MNKILALIIILFAFSFYGCTHGEGDQNKMEPDVSNVSNDPCMPDIVISLHRESVVFTSEAGETIAEMYFDKLILTGNATSIPTINEFFDEECQGFFYGSEKSAHFKTGLYNQFARSVDDARSIYGDSTLAVGPLINKVDTEVTYMNTEMISVKESLYWMAGGIGDHCYYGATFNIQTGDILPLNYFVEENINEFNENVVSLICNYISENDSSDNRIDIENKFVSHQFEDYDFYYDGENINLIFNLEFYSNDSFILQYANPNK